MGSQSVDPQPIRTNISDIYAEAVLHDAQLSALRHAYKAQAEQLPQARSGLLPTLAAGATSDATTLSRESASSRERSGLVFKANLSQPLFRPDRWYGLKAAEDSVLQAEIELAAKEQELIVRVVEAYTDVLRQQDENAVSKAEETAFLHQRELAQGRLDDGVASITDVLDAQAAYDIARANKLTSERRLEDGYESLTQITGKEYHSLAGLKHELPTILPAPRDSSAWVAFGLQQNLEYLAAQRAVKVANNTVLQRKSGHSPSLDLVASYRRGDNDSFGYTNSADVTNGGYRGNIAQATIAIELNLPIYNGGSVSSQVRESTQRLSQREDEQESKRRQVVLNIRNAYRAVNDDVEQLVARLSSVKSAHKALEANEVGLQVGTRNIGDVLSAQKQLFAAVRQYNNARYDYVNDVTNLKMHSGMLMPGDINSLNSYLDSSYVADRDYLPIKISSDDRRAAPN